MGLRPQPARWFEALAARDDLTRLAEALARTGVVQIEIATETDEAEPASNLASILDEYDRLARRYCPYWPSDLPPQAGTSGRPAVVAERALGRIRDWVSGADPLVTDLQRREHEQEGLCLLRELFDACGGEGPDLSELSAAGPTLVAKLYAVAPERKNLVLPDDCLVKRLPGDDHVFLIVAGPAATYAEAERRLLLAKARPIELPSSISVPASARLAWVDGRVAEVEIEIAGLRRELGRLAQVHDLSTVLADLERVRWFVGNLPRLSETRHFALVTGWTTDPTGALLLRSLERSGLRALLRFPPPPAGSVPPIVLDNPRWARAFETFARLLGTPARHEPDPSVLVAGIAPLLFGFMFGDVGHGLVLVAIGLFLRRRMPALGLLVPGGLAAMVFGLLYGSVFALEGILEPLWFSPMSRPLIVLGASVLGGVVILSIGLLLSGLEAFWRGAFGRFLAAQAALVVVYLSLIGSLVRPWSALGALFGALWFVSGSAVLAPNRRVAAALGAIGHLLERTLELGINSISFARVGAFALAHAGLSTAIAALSAAAGHPIAAVVVLVAGNLLIITLEGLVVSVQTTRLILFEFFVRFLRGEGRMFRPLPPPAPFGQAAPVQGVRRS
jgi:V/A-type H+/Na+-transporting ATPase subunit I